MLAFYEIGPYGLMDSFKCEPKIISSCHELMERRVDMATIIPEGEKIRQAVKWISCECQEDESRKITLLIQEASMRFNLSPKEEEFLRCFYEENEP